MIGSKRQNLKSVSQEHRIFIHIKKKQVKELGTVIQACNPNTWKTEIGGQQVQNQSRLHSETPSGMKEGKKERRK
jgi:hypothetical protein